MNNNKGRSYIDNRGSSLVLALVVVSFVAILGTTVITMALTSLKVKSMDGRVKKAYYNADMAVDEIYTTLAETAYSQLDAAYKDVVTNLLKVDSSAVSLITNAEANSMLKQEYFTGICKEVLSGCFADGTTPEGVALAIENCILGTGSISGQIVNTKLADKLVGYLSIPGGAKYEIKIELPSDPVVIERDAEGFTATGIILKDVQVTYVNNDTNYFSRITTDFRLVFPEDKLLELVKNSGDVLLSFRDYSLVSDGVVQGNAIATVNGGIYGKGGVNVNSTLTMTESQSGNLVTGVDNKVTIHGGSLIHNNGRIWADDITMLGGTFNMGSGSAAYIADDLSINSGANNVEIKGDYYGYSIEGHVLGSTAPSNSSAIIINSSNTKLDLSGIKTLVLGGYGWVVYDGSASGYYRTGESIAVKFTQSAYVLPSEWNDVVSGNFFGKTLLNPDKQVIDNGTEHYYNFKSGEAAAKFYRAIFDDSEYNKLCDDAGLDPNDVDVAAIRDSIRSILTDIYTSQFGEGKENSITINEYARVYKTGIIRKGNSAEAGEYNNILAADVARLYSNSLWRSKIISSLLIEMSDDWNYGDYSNWEDSNPALNYGSMKYSYKLTDKSVLDKGAVENILKGRDKIVSSQYFYPVDETTKRNSSDYVVYVTSGDCNLSNVLPPDISKGIVITTGSINVNTTFTGCIIACGDITISGGSYTADPDLVDRIFNELPNIRGFFDGVSVVYDGHITYNDGVGSTIPSMDEGDLTRYSPDDCVYIENYRR